MHAGFKDLYLRPCSQREGVLEANVADADKHSPREVRHWHRARKFGQKANRARNQSAMQPPCSCLHNLHALCGAAALPCTCSWTVYVCPSTLAGSARVAALLV